MDGGYEKSTAMYVYPGRDDPISSLRLENLRDGIEDYELLCSARDRLADLERRKISETRLVEQMRQAITLEDRFAKDHPSYSTVPHVLARHRRELIEALEQAEAVKRIDRQIHHDYKSTRNSAVSHEKSHENFLFHKCQQTCQPLTNARKVIFRPYSK